MLLNIRCLRFTVLNFSTLLRTTPQNNQLEKGSFCKFIQTKTLKITCTKQFTTFGGYARTFRAVLVSFIPLLRAQGCSPAGRWTVAPEVRSALEQVFIQQVSGGGGLVNATPCSAHHKAPGSADQRTLLLMV